MTSLFYDTYHVKNQFSASRPITLKNYTYQTILKLIDIYFENHKKVLDVGCGVGTVALYLAQTENRVVGIDISRRAIDLARKSAKLMKFHNVEFKVVDVQNIKMKSEKFDYVVCSEVIEHIKDDKKLIRDIADTLKHKGLLILSTPSINAPLYKLGKLNEFDKSVGHLRRYSTQQLKLLLEQSDFSIIKIIKVEGLLRNYLYTNNLAGKLIKFIRWPITIPINFIDTILLYWFGESNIYVIAQRK